MLTAAASATRYSRWLFLRSAASRGWWLVTAVYLVVDAELGPAQLVLIGTAQGLTVLVAEVPAGVVADVVSRRRALVIAQVVSGVGMAATGFVTSYPLLVITQCLWGLGWAFSSGADTAWITDEVADSAVIDRVLARGARWALAGAATGTIFFGAVAWATRLDVAIVTAGAVMLALSIYVARFPETNFRRASGTTPSGLQVARRGLGVVRADRVIFMILLSTLLVNGAGEGYGRLLERRLIDLGMPQMGELIVSFAALSLACLVLGAVMLSLAERRIEGAGAARRIYVTMTFVSAAGILVFAHASTAAVGLMAVLLVNGFAGPVARPVSDIWINRRTPSAVRATVHSLNSQAENLGEILFGFPLAAAAGALSATAALTGCAILTAVAGFVVLRSDDGAVPASAPLGVNDLDPA